MADGQRGVQRGVAERGPTLAQIRAKVAMHSYAPVTRGHEIRRAEPGTSQPTPAAPRVFRGGGYLNPPAILEVGYRDPEAPDGDRICSDRTDAPHDGDRTWFDRAWTVRDGDSTCCDRRSSRA